MIHQSRSRSPRRLTATLVVTISIAAGLGAVLSNSHATAVPANTGVNRHRAAFTDSKNQVAPVAPPVNSHLYDVMESGVPTGDPPDNNGSI